MAVRKPWSAVVTHGPHWARYRLQLDVTDLIRLRNALASLNTDQVAGPDMAALIDIFWQLDTEVEALPPEVRELIRQEQTQ